MCQSLGMAVESQVLEAGISTRNLTNTMCAWLPFSSKGQYSQYCNKSAVLSEVPNHGVIL